MNQGHNNHLLDYRVDNYGRKEMVGVMMNKKKEGGSKVYLRNKIFT